MLRWISAALTDPVASTTCAAGRCVLGTNQSTARGPAWPPAAPPAAAFAPSGPCPSSRCSVSVM
eukprot:scaffold43100_cov22-Tisochrysis_lutea.AAC.1